MSDRVVIAGGGFGGFYAARALERRLAPAGVRVTLVSDTNFMLYTPLLPGAAGGSLEPRHVVVPLREQLSHTEIVLGTVTGADPGSRRLLLTTAAGEERSLTYTHLIVALGSVSRTFPVPGVVEHASGFKSLEEGIALRNRVVRNLEIAEALEDPARRAEYLGFVFVGGGYAGLEGLAELQDFAAALVTRYPRCAMEGMRWVLVEAAERVMGEIPASLAAFTTRELQARGVEVRTSTTVTEVTETGVALSDGETVPARMVVWTTGVRPHPVVSRLGLELTADGRVAVDRELRALGTDGVWAVGDCAAVPSPPLPRSLRGAPVTAPPTAQHAIREGRRAARNVSAALGRGRIRPFRYRTLGVFVDLGANQAVASTLGLRWRGPVAWFMARTYHLAMMPGTMRKLRLVTDWTLGLVFGRDGAELGRLGHPESLRPDV